MSSRQVTNQELRTCTGKKVFPFIDLQWFFMAVSIFFVAASLYMISVKGLNYGTDFLGGTKTVFEFNAGIGIDKIRAAVDSLKWGDASIVRFGDVQSTKNQYMIRVKFIEGRDTASELAAVLAKAFGEGKANLLSQEVVGPKVGKDLQRKAIISIVWTCVLIMAYLGFRFDFLFAPGAVIALLHDVIISVGFFAFLGKEFNLPILAAVLTILGYSVNDTIVVYDRIRENILRLPAHFSTRDIVNISVTETLRRTVVTSLTVLFVVVVLFLLGGGVLHDFAFCLIVGVIFGSYSTIFIASPVYIWLQKAFPNRGLRMAQHSH